RTATLLLESRIARQVQGRPVEDPALCKRAGSRESAFAVLRPDEPPPTRIERRSRAVPADGLEHRRQEGVDRKLRGQLEVASPTGADDPHRPVAHRATPYIVALALPDRLNLCPSG